MDGTQLFRTQQARLEQIGLFGGGRRYFVFIDTSNEGFPLRPTRRAYRETIYRDPIDPKQAADFHTRAWIRRRALFLLSNSNAPAVDCRLSTGMGAQALSVTEPSGASELQVRT